jgi:hypothetical protein
MLPGAEYANSGEDAQDGPCRALTIPVSELISTGKDTRRVAGATQKSASPGHSVGSAGTPSTPSQGNAPSKWEGSGQHLFPGSDNSKGSRTSGARQTGSQEAARVPGQPSHAPVGSRRDGPKRTEGQAEAARELFPAMQEQPTKLAVGTTGASPAAAEENPE